MDFIETLKMSENDLFYNFGGTIGMWIGWSVLTFSSIPLIFMSISNGLRNFMTRQINISVNIFIRMKFIFQLFFEDVKFWLYYARLKINNLINYNCNLKLIFKTLLNLHYLYKLVMLFLRFTFKLISIAVIQLIQMLIYLINYLFNEHDDFLL